MGICRSTFSDTLQIWPTMNLVNDMARFGGAYDAIAQSLGTNGL
jgi:hypothetical protein